MGVGSPPFLLSDIQTEIEGSSTGAYSLSTADSKSGFTAPTLMSEYDFYVHKGAQYGYYINTPVGTPQVRSDSCSYVGTLGTSNALEYTPTVGACQSNGVYVTNGGAAYKSFDGVTCELKRRPKTEGTSTSGWASIETRNNYTSDSFTGLDYSTYDYMVVVTF